MLSVEMQNITKTFGGFKANDSVHFRAKQGEIHALVGENGAGKSTLMKILYGMYQPDTGTIIINGKAQIIDSPKTAISLGIGMVHQHFMLVDNLTVLENIILGDETTKAGGVIDHKASTQKINDLTKTFNINIELNRKIEGLPVGTQQKIEIMKLLYRNAEILILDEPTAVLTPQETDELFVTLNKLKASDKTIILITHKLSEVFSASESVTVLRQGKSVAELQTSATNRTELAHLIVGEEITRHVEKKNYSKENIILAVKRLSVINENKLEAVKNVSFDIKAGEVFGIAGVEGNGQSELIEAINGLCEISGGDILLNGKPLRANYPIAHIPADRHKNGIVKEFSISDNIILGRVDEKTFSTPYSFKEKEILNYTNKLIADYDIRPPGASIKIGGLSGGNQQKAVAARELTKDTPLIIASHPTRGLDIKASEFVHSALLAESAKDKAVLVVSSDLNELLKICDRIAVMYNGEIVTILNVPETNEREIGTYMTGLHKD